MSLDIRHGKGNQWRSWRNVKQKFRNANIWIRFLSWKSTKSNLKDYQKIIIFFFLGKPKWKFVLVYLYSSIDILNDTSSCNL